jgi:hypothetical protein
MFWIIRLLIKYFIFPFLPPTLLVWILSCALLSHLLHSFYHGKSLSKVTLTTILPSLPTTCIKLTGWHHTTETFHRPRSSLYKLCTAATGFPLDSWTLRMGQTGCPETSVGNYHYSLRNSPERRSSQSLKTQTEFISFMMGYSGKFLIQHSKILVFPKRRQVPWKSERLVTYQYTFRSTTRVMVTT